MYVEKRIRTKKKKYSTKTVNRRNSSPQKRSFLKMKDVKSSKGIQSHSYIPVTVYSNNYKDSLFSFLIFVLRIHYISRIIRDLQRRFLEDCRENHSISDITTFRRESRRERRKRTKHLTSYLFLQGGPLSLQSETFYRST